MEEYILTAIVMVHYTSAYATLTWQFENWKQRMSICNSLFPFMNVVRAGMDWQQTIGPMAHAVAIELSLILN